MDRNALLAELTRIFISVLDEDTIELRPESTAADVEGWDSLTHIQIISAIEKRFRIRFTAEEITGFQKVGDLCDAIDRKVTG